jgi:hypothetical protein
MVFLSCTTGQCLPGAIELVRALIAESPHLTVIGGGTAAVAHPTELLEAGVAEVCATRAEVRHVVRLYALRRSVSRPSRINIDSGPRPSQIGIDPAFAGLRTVAPNPAPVQASNGVAATPTPTETPTRTAPAKSS